MHTLDVVDVGDNKKAVSIALCVVNLANMNDGKEGTEHCRRFWSKFSFSCRYQNPQVLF